MLFKLFWASLTALVYLLISAWAASLLAVDFLMISSKLAMVWVSWVCLLKMLVMLTS